MKRKDLKPGTVFRYVNDDSSLSSVHFVPPKEKVVDSALGDCLNNPSTCPNLEREVIVLALPKNEPDAPPTVTSLTSLPHYITGGIETIDVIEAWNLPPHLANVVKYIGRHGKKPGEDAKKDLMKARAYLTRYINLLDGKHSWGENV